MANAQTKNSWLQNKLGKINRGIMKFGETVGSPIRKPIEGYFANQKKQELEQKMKNKERLQKAKDAYQKKYGKPYDWKTANPQDTNKLYELF